MSLKSLKIDKSNLLNPDLATCGGAAQGLWLTFVLSTLLSMHYREDIRNPRESFLVCYCRYMSASAWDRSCSSVETRFLAEHNALVTLLSMIDIQPHGSGRFFIIVVAQPTRHLFGHLRSQPSPAIE